jgi:ribose 5-phosphate isomerase B
VLSERDLEEVVRQVVARHLAGGTPPGGSGATAAGEASGTPVAARPAAPPAAGVAPAKRLALGADHGGFELKEKLKPFLYDLGWSVDDCGTWSEQPVDYPDIAHRVARKVAAGEARLGIVIDGAGIGSAMAANKVPGIRAALCYDIVTARNSREHNDANVLTLGGRLIGIALAQEIVRNWLGTECREERHRKRVAMIEAIEREYGGAAASVASPRNADVR